MTQLHAQPYDISANGFYFETAEEYTSKANALRNDYGDPVEEFEIQFIDGKNIDCNLAKAIDLNQGNFIRYFDIVEKWEEWEKLLVVLAVGECGYPRQSHEFHAPPPAHFLLSLDVVLGSWHHHADCHSGSWAHPASFQAKSYNQITPHHRNIRTGLAHRKLGLLTQKHVTLIIGHT